MEQTPKDSRHLFKKWHGVARQKKKKKQHNVIFLFTLYTYCPRSDFLFRGLSVEIGKDRWSIWSKVCIWGRTPDNQCLGKQPKQKCKNVWRHQILVRLALAFMHCTMPFIQDTVPRCAMLCHSISSQELYFCLSLLFEILLANERKLCSGKTFCCR